MRHQRGLMRQPPLTREMNGGVEIWLHSRNAKGPMAVVQCKHWQGKTVGGKVLLTLIAKRTPEQQQKLLNVAHEGEYWRPTCARCGIKMVERTPNKA